MTDRDKSVLECPEKMCEYCCNFDREHIGMDGTALCKPTMTLAYAEDYGGNCMFYKVPKEQIIIPPCKVGDKVYIISRNKVKECEVVFIGISADEKCSYFNFVEHYADGTFYKSYSMVFEVIGKTVFLTKEEAEAELQKRGKENAENN